MEPMALGSPVSSPSQTSNSPGPSSTYLPGFLLGDNNPQARIGVMTPESGRYSHTGHGLNQNSPLASHATPELRINRQKAIFKATSNSNLSQIGQDNHVNGPPTKSLYDSLDTRQSISNAQNVSMSHQSFNQSKVLGGGYANTTINSPFCETPVNMTQNESTQGLLQWITVFGFPMSALNTVLSHISSRVRIIDKHPAPQAQSNWIHLKCSSEQEAQRALSCNGNIISGSIMIGVLPCTDEGVILSTDKENRTKMSESLRLFSTPIKPASACYSGNRTPVRIQNARPLVSGYNQHLSPQSVRSPDDVPHKSSGLVTKAMEYVFGW